MHASSPIEAVVFARDRYRCVCCGALGVPTEMAVANRVDIERHTRHIESRAHALATLVDAKDPEIVLMALAIAARTDREIAALTRMSAELQDVRSVKPLPTIWAVERHPRVPGQRPGANMVTLCGGCRDDEIELRRFPAVSSAVAELAVAANGNGQHAG